MRTIQNKKSDNISQDDNILYKNSVESKQNSSSGDWVHANTAEYILKMATPVYKEGKYACKFDGMNWTGPTSPKFRPNYWKKLITEPGTYVEWFININMDGSMQRKAEVSDKLTKALRLFISIRLGHQ